MTENIYLNYLPKSKLTSVDKDERRYNCKPVLRILSVLLFLSLVANGVMAYLYHTKNPNPLCEPSCLKSYSRSDAHQVMRINSMNKHMLPNHCSDLKEKWIQNMGRFYVFSSDVMDWSSSRKRCQDLGGDLVIINSTEEQDFLSKKVNGVNDYHWIGLSDSETEGVWLWVDNTTLNSNLLWATPPDDWKEENPLHGEDCAILNGKKWGDVSCLRKVKRICEIHCSSLLHMPRL